MSSIADLTDWELLQRIDRNRPDYEALAEAVRRGLAEDPDRRNFVNGDGPYRPVDEVAARAHPTLRRIWSPLVNVRLERVLWWRVMRIQKGLGVAIPQDAIDASERVLKPEEEVLERIRQRELKTRHDLKARLEIFCEDAGHEYHHLGMTSADVVENVYQWRVRDSILMLNQLWDADIAIQEWYPLRGIKGPMGTQEDQVDLLGSYEAAQTLDRRLAEELGFWSFVTTPPQVMYRSLDERVVTELLSVATARSKGPGRPLLVLLSGYATMAAAIAGDTWLEGDVSTSVVRRVALPGAIFAFDVAMRGWKRPA